MFDGNEDCVAAVEALSVAGGAMIMIGHQRPKGAGMREGLSTTAAQRRPPAARTDDGGAAAIRRYSKTAGPAWHGMVTHSGARSEAHGYADI